MDTKLAQLYLQHIEPSNSSLINQIGDEILAQYENPNSFLEIISILTTPDMILLVRKSAAIGLKKVIQNHLKFLITDLRSNNEQSALNNLLQILSMEENPEISLLIITSLAPVFKEVGDSWAELTQLLAALFVSNNPTHINIGLQLMSDFLPYASTGFVSQYLPTIAQFLQLALNSDNSDILVYGVQLFSSLLQTEIPISQFSETFLTIFRRSLEIFHKFLIDDDMDNGSKISNSISKMLKSDPLISPAPELYKLLLQLLSDTSISKDTHHLPLFPIKELIKYYGSELQEFFPQSSQLFILIASRQFNDVGFFYLDGPLSIIPLFEHMANSVSDPKQFIAFVLQNSCQTDNIPQSFASICAFLGISESECDEFENFCSQIVEYSFEKLKLQNMTLTQAILKLLFTMNEQQGVPMTKYANVMNSLAFSLYQAHSDEDLVHSSLDLICSIYDNDDIESSFVIESLPNLIQAYQQASLVIKPDFMKCISRSIFACGEDSAVFADTLLPIVYQGCHSNLEEEVDNRAKCIEALGALLSYVPEKCQDIYEDSIKMILTAASDSNIGLCSIGLKALINVIKINQGQLPIDFSTAAIQAATNAMKLKIPEGDVHIEDDSCYSIEEIIVLGLKLLFFLLKYCEESCRKIESGLPTLIESSFTSKPIIQIAAMKAAAYYIIKFNPEQTNVYDYLFNNIVQSKDNEIVIASFNTFKKLLWKSKSRLLIPNLERFTMASLACLAHQLPFQEGSFEYIENVSEMLSNFIESIIILQTHTFPGQKFIETVSAVIENVSIKESFAILDVLATFIKYDGFVTNEILSFALNKLQLCDFSHGPEPIIFIHSLIKYKPELLADKIDPIIQFFLQQLSVEEVSLKFYWPTIMNIISAIFTLMLSNTFINEAIKSDQCIMLILSKLPVKGDYVEACNIYQSILDFIRIKGKNITPFIPEILRVFVQTLAFSPRKFEKINFDLPLFEKIVTGVKYIFQSYPQLQQQVPEILNNDNVKYNHFISRLNSINANEK
ncbi:hypothetical protein M9Y10_025570 [Tritrichomonas musculus]|uniref:Importin N-terminal domain-containing protein n=1 Tax=Tritrichomonas musculus TaxID=1915356 RepID=A0ABR2H928_9EUKA